jgi:cytosine/adenosine deaminase-related metal-dependent hydrolase
VAAKTLPTDAKTLRTDAKTLRTHGKTLLVKHAHTLVTMDEQRRELADGALFIRGPCIEQVGSSADLEHLADGADEVLDLKGRHVVLPGLVNTHHHFYQTLTRAVPQAQSSELFAWLKHLYPLWMRLDARGVYVSAQMTAAELLLSGCTTTSDHLYLFPNDCTLDEEIRALGELGMRFHPSRGSMSVGESQGGLPPDALCESESHILKDSQRLIERYHDNSRHAMTRMTLAPCSPFSVSRHLMRESAALARSFPGVRLHTHLAETELDVKFSRETFGMAPGEFADDVGWTGSDVWHAHCVHLDEPALLRFARTGTGVAHCPSSNQRLGSGIARVPRMLELGIAVGLGVDGAASNDGCNLLHEARAACLLARVGARDAAALQARTALELATRGGARVLGRDDIGCLSAGMSADFIALNVDRPQFAGAWDLVAAIILCQPDRVDFSYINGRKIIDEGRLVTAELPLLVERTQAAALTMARVQ